MVRERWAALAGAVAGTVAWAVMPAQAVDLIQVLPAALDQPQINLIAYVGNNTLPQVGQTTTIDPNTLDTVTMNTFTITAYLDTGASSILISTPTNSILNLPLLYTNGTPVIYSDVGVAGTDDYQVSDTVRLSLANYYQRTDLDQFSDPAQTIPITAPYTPMGPPHSTVRVQVGPYVPTVTNPIDDISQLIADFSAVDVVGMPAMVGRVVVIDPTRVNNFGVVLDALANDPSNFDPNLLNQDLSAHTFIYAPGTPFNPATTATDPGIPQTQLHVKLSYASFDRFTTVTPAGQPGPTLEHNPFIGQDPVRLMDGTPQANVPGIKITHSTTINGVPTVLSSEGNWLLDTGAAASIISTAQAARLDVTYQAGTFGTDTPVLVDQNGMALPNQFTLQIAGVGGQETLAGFYLDSMLVRTIEGIAANDNDPNHLRFLEAPVLVGDVTVKDPVTQQTLTLDGIFGMNNLIASADFSLDATGNISNLSASTGNFNWITIDEPNALLGLNIDPATGLSLPTTVNLGDGTQEYNTSQVVGALVGSGLSEVIVDAGVTISSGGVNVGTLQVNGVHIIHASATLSGRTSRVGTLQLAGVPGAWTGLLDLTNNNLIVSSGIVASQIKQAAALGAWTGTGGITSSSAKAAAATATPTALGYASGAEYTAATGQTVFDGQTFNPTDTLVSYTLAGDANLDGTVTFADFLAMQNDYNKAGDWMQGDWNYDGQVTFADFLILQDNYNKVLTAGTLTPAVATAGGTGTAAAPEPGALAVMVLGGLALLRRRRGLSERRQ